MKIALRLQTRKLLKSKYFVMLIIQHSEFERQKEILIIQHSEFERQEEINIVDSKFILHCVEIWGWAKLG